jgi:glycerophosphoryl diester phosphodiesterase
MDDIRFLAAPIAHRGLHDAAAGVVENSLPAIAAAVAAGFAVEIDVQLSRDGEAMVFHDPVLDRLTARTGPVRALDAAVLRAVALRGGRGATIPTLAQALAVVAGRVGVVVEIKDQGGRLDDSGVGPLEARVAQALAAYAGPAAVMSFNADSMAAMARLAPATPRGLVGRPAREYPSGPDVAALARMQDLTALRAVGGRFVSYAHAALPFAAALAARQGGAMTQCWTLRDDAAATRALRHADGVTFEGWRPG